MIEITDSQITKEDDQGKKPTLSSFIRREFIMVKLALFQFK